MTMRFTRSIVLSFALAGAAVSSLATDAVACGGCFAPPGAAQVVTDHRMVLSLSSEQSTLWDQFQYSGNPEDFSWILPIRYTDATRVQLASDDFLTLLTNVGVPAMNAPAPPPYPPGCEPPWVDDAERGGSVDASAPSFADAAASADSGVMVLRQEVVGPYAVSIVRGDSGMGLRDWLRMNGYVIPSAVEPVIDYYVGLHMDFVALRLRSGEGLNRMVPVRVTTAGYAPSLPLRMISAGAADRVGLSLTVIAAARIEAMNFPNGEFTNNDFTYDWNLPPSDLGRVFIDAFNTRNRASGDRLWLTESSMRFDQYSLSSLAARLPSRFGFAPGDGGSGMAVSSAVDDVNTAFMGLGSTAMITRMRADLPARMLDRDLQLAASDSGPRDRTYTFGRELNRPMYLACPWPARDAGGPDVPMSLPPISTDASVDADPTMPPIPTMGGGTATPSTASGGIQCSTTRPGDREDRASALLALPLFDVYVLSDSSDPALRAAEVQAWQRLLAQDRIFGLGATVDGQLVGIVHALFHSSTWADSVCYLQDLFTAEHARNKGVATALIEAVYARAKTDGASRVHWLTHETNLNAQKLYEKIAVRSGFIQYRKVLTL